LKRGRTSRWIKTLLISPTIIARIRRRGSKRRLRSNRRGLRSNRRLRRRGGKFWTPTISPLRIGWGRRGLLRGDWFRAPIIATTSGRVRRLRDGLRGLRDRLG
jgi:hypothetical protein